MNILITADTCDAICIIYSAPVFVCVFVLEMAELLYLSACRPGLLLRPGAFGVVGNSPFPPAERRYRGLTLRFSLSRSLKTAT